VQGSHGRSGSCSSPVLVHRICANSFSWPCLEDRAKLLARRRSLRARRNGFSSLIFNFRNCLAVCSRRSDLQIGLAAASTRANPNWSAIRGVLVRESNWANDQASLQKRSRLRCVPEVHQNRSERPSRRRDDGALWRDDHIHDFRFQLGSEFTGCPEHSDRECLRANRGAEQEQETPDEN
jgi:hypothetical protein